MRTGSTDPEVVTAEVNKTISRMGPFVVKVVIETRDGQEIATDYISRNAQWGDEISYRGTLGLRVR